MKPRSALAVLPLSLGVAAADAAAQSLDIREWPVPWVDTNRFAGFDPRTEQFIGSTAIAGGGGAVRHMVFHAPPREIWFGTDANTVGRVKVP